MHYQLSMACKECCSKLTGTLLIGFSLASWCAFIRMLTAVVFCIVLGSCEHQRNKIPSTLPHLPDPSLSFSEGLGTRLPQSIINWQFLEMLDFLCDVMRMRKFDYYSADHTLGGQPRIPNVLRSMGKTRPTHEFPLVTPPIRFPRDKFWPSL